MCLYSPKIVTVQSKELHFLDQAQQPEGANVKKGQEEQPQEAEAKNGQAQQPQKAEVKTLRRHSSLSPSHAETRVSNALVAESIIIYIII
jgi:hypothetical protein